jgi:F0F1-type ATP synthase membrane subunit b/b'
MKLRTSILSTFAMAVLAAGLVGCEKHDTASGDKGPAERAGQQLDQAASKAGEELNKAAVKAGEGLQQAGKELQNKAAEAQKNNDNNKQ